MPDEGYREWLLDWLGWVIQNPDQRSPVVPVLVSGQGAGKDVFLAVISHVIGLQNFLKLRPAELSSDFNGWVRRRFVHLDEVRFDGAGKAYNTIKSLTGQSKGGRVRVNEKFKESYSIEFAGVFFATTNEASALKGIEHDDRRFAGYCSPAGRLDEIWGEDEFDEVSSIAEAERVHEFLLTRDVSTFNAYQPPKDDTGSRTEIITASLTEAGIEAYNLVTSGEFAERELFTLVEVMDHLVRHPNPTVRNRLTQHAVRQGLLAAECEQCHGGKLVRSDGKLVRIWVNGTVDASERVYLIGKHPTRGAPAPKELATRMAEDREAAATRLQEQLLGLSGT
jgi:hypothetical protein